MAVGISSVDSNVFAARRAAQRASWFSYEDVATQANGFSGRMFVEYYTGCSHDRGYEFSQDLITEAATHGDILVMDIKEVKRREKTGLVYQTYGVAPEIIMAFKSLAYYCYAEKTYVNAKFIVKSDDDQFIRVPMIMATMDELPAHGAVWGRLIYPPTRRYGSTIICGVSGMWIAMTRDILHILNSLPEIQDFGALEVDGDKLLGAANDSVTLNFIHNNTGLWAEDIPPGIVLYYLAGSGTPANSINLGYDVVYHTEASCRFQDPGNSTTNWLRYEVSPASTIIHHANYYEQTYYRGLFPDNLTYPIAFTPLRRAKQPCHGVVLKTSQHVCTLHLF